MQSGPGTDVPYSVTLRNLGPDNATNVVLDDPIPPGMTFVSRMQNSGPAFSCTDPGVGNNGPVNCTIATLVAGAIADFTFVFHIAPATPPGTTFTNIATASSATPDPNPENDSGTAATSTPPPPTGDMNISKLGPSTAGPNTNVVYTITVGNSGPDAATTVAWSDTLPGTMTFVSLMQNNGPVMSCTDPGVGNGGTINCSIASFPALATATFTLTGHIPTGTPSGTTYTNNATVTAANDPNPDNNSASTILTVSSVDVSVTKSGPGTATAGTDISYTITVAITGDTANVNFSDAVPPGTTFASMTQNTGPASFCATPPPNGTGSVNCSITAMTNTSAQFTLVLHITNATTISNTVTANSDGFDTNPSNNTATASTTVTQRADMAVTKNGPAMVTAGTNITYSVIVTNNGPSNAASVSLTDTLPPSTTFVSNNQTAGPTFSCTNPAVGAGGTITCTIASLTAGTSATFSFVFNVAPGASGSINNTANVSSSTTDPTPGNNSSTSSAVVNPGPTDVSIVKTANNNRVETGSSVTYTIVVTNNGPGVAAGTTVTDALPPGATATSATSTQGTCSGTTTVTCSVGTLAPSATATITLQVTLTTLGITPNTATVTIANTDTNPTNNSSTAQVEVLPVGAIPTLSPLALAFLGIALAAVAMVVGRR